MSLLGYLHGFILVFSRYLPYHSVTTTHRVAATENNHCNRVYLRKKTERSTPVTEHEQLARARFTAVAAAVKARRKNLQTITADQQAFAEQKDTANGRKTFKAYLWQVCGEEYDAQH